MPQPPSYNPAFDFSDFQAANPSKPLPGDKLDIELNRIAQTTGAIRTNLALVQRDDGRLGNRTVHPDALDLPMRRLLAAHGGTVRGEWAAGVVYAAKDIVTRQSATYIATGAHTSSASFTADLALVRWLRLTDSADASTVVELARRWAEEDEDTLVDPATGGYSARHWAAKAQSAAVFGNFPSGSFVGDGTATVFTLQEDPGVAAAVLWVEGGVIQKPGVDYSVSGTSLTRTTAPADGVPIHYVLLGKKAEVAASVADAGNVTFTPVGGLAATNVAAALYELDSEKVGPAHTHTAAQVTDFAEAVDDRVGNLFEAGANITLNYNDAAGRFVISASGDPVTAFDPTGTGLRATTLQDGLVEAWGELAVTDARLAALAGEYLAHAANASNPHGTTAAQVGAIALSQRGAANGVAELDNDGRLLAQRMPLAYAKGAANGVAPLGADGRLASGYLPAAGVALDADQTFSGENRFFYAGTNADKVWLSHADSGSAEIFDAWNYRSPLVVSMRSDADASTKPGNTDSGLAMFYYDVRGSTPPVWNGAQTAVVATGGIWPGVVIDVHKYGNSSAHCVTASAALHECSPNTGYPGYNEVGLYQGNMYNMGSYYGLLEGVGLQIYDTHGGSVDAYRANARATAMTGIVLNLHKYSSTFDTAKYNTTGVMVNSAGDYPIHRGIYLSGGMYIGLDLRDAAFNTAAIALKNEHDLQWGDGGAAMRARMNSSGAFQWRTTSNLADASHKFFDAYGNVKIQFALNSDSPLYINFEGTMRQVRLGAPDSGGSGRRMLYCDN